MQRLSRDSTTEVETMVSVWKEMKLFSVQVWLRNTGWLVLFVSVARLSSGPGWKDGVPGGDTHVPVPSVGWALSLARGCIPPLYDQRVLLVRSLLLVTVPSTYENPPLENLCLRIISEYWSLNLSFDSNFPYASSQKLEAGFLS